MNIHDFNDLYTRDPEKLGLDAAKAFHPIKCTRLPPPTSPSHALTCFILTYKYPTLYMDL